MSRGFALLIGLGQVDAKIFLSSLKCGAETNEDNLLNMMKLLYSLGFSCTSLVTGQATKAAIKQALADQANTLLPGDLFVFYFTGHKFGMEMGVPTDSLAAFDGMLSPADLQPIWEGISAGVRIFSISDACSSGSTYELPPALRLDSDSLHFDALAAEPFDNTSLAAQMIHFGAARQGTAAAGGFFTQALLSVWNNGAFGGTYRTFFCAILRELISKVPGETAQYLPHGPLTTDFEGQQPFTIAAPQTSSQISLVTDGISDLSQCTAASSLRARVATRAKSASTQPFTLKVQFTGLCSFVPNDTLANATKLMVVLPNADFPQKIGTPPPSSLDHQALRRHRGMVRVPLANLGLANAPANGSAVQYIAPGCRIQFQTDPPAAASSGLNISIGNKPDSFTLVVPMADLMPSPNDIDPSAVSFPPPLSVLGQVLIEGGTVTTSPNPEVWVFEPPPASGRITPIAHEVTVTYSLLNQASIVTTVGGSRYMTQLVPDANNVAAVRILNACDDNPLEWPRIPNPTIDVDFRWFYELLPPASKITLLSKLTPAGLGLPRPIGAGGGGADCSPALWGPISF